MYFTHTVRPYLGGAQHTNSRHTSLNAAEQRIVALFRANNADYIDVDYLGHRALRVTPEMYAAIVPGDETTFIGRRIAEAIAEKGITLPRVRGARKQEVLALLEEELPAEKATAMLEKLRGYLK